MIINPYLFGSTPLLLDTYSGAAAAYSLRLLRTAYTGNTIRVRRSSDNAEQDFGFSSNVLDTASLLTFCGVGNGFVTTWYDQSGNALNFTQATAINQPQIVSAGAVITQNSKPALLNDGVNDSLRNALNVASGNTLCVFYPVAKIGNGTNDGYAPTIAIATSNNSDIGALHYIKTSNVGASYPFYNNFFFYDNAALTYTVGTMYLMSVMFPGATPWRVYRNSIQEGSIATYGTFQTVQTGFDLGRQLTPSRYSNNKYSEVIFYTSNQTTNRTGIEANITAFY